MIAAVSPVKSSVERDGEKENEGQSPSRSEVSGRQSPPWNGVRSGRFNEEAMQKEMERLVKRRFEIRHIPELNIIFERNGYTVTDMQGQRRKIPYSRYAHGTNRAASEVPSKEQEPQVWVSDVKKLELQKNYCENQITVEKSSGQVASTIMGISDNLDISDSLSGS